MTHLALNKIIAQEGVHTKFYKNSSSSIKFKVQQVVRTKFYKNSSSSIKFKVQQVVQTKFYKYSSIGSKFYRKTDGQRQQHSNIHTYTQGPDGVTSCKQAVYTGIQVYTETLHFLRVRRISLVQ
jgi:hypothetical protein